MTRRLAATLYARRDAARRDHLAQRKKRHDAGRKAWATAVLNAAARCPLMKGRG